MEMRYFLYLIVKKKYNLVNFSFLATWEIFILINTISDKQ